MVIVKQKIKITKHFSNAKFHEIKYFLKFSYIEVF